MTPDTTQDIEITLLLEAMYQCYGYDFRNYAKATIRRRIKQFVEQKGHKHISEVLPDIIHNRQTFQALINEFSITVTEMFRDPAFYLSIRQNVIPLLKTYPFIKVWHAGCSTGEEVYSMAIVLKEEGLYDRATIFATDMNDNALAQAKEGIFPLEHIQEYTRNYQQSGGKYSFGDYYHADQEHMIVHKELKKNITFANHNLTIDQVFAEMHLICCRNVMIYFNKTLQNQVLKLLEEATVRGGFLCLGTKEAIRFSPVYTHFKDVDEPNKIFQKHLDSEQLPCKA